MKKQLVSLLVFFSINVYAQTPEPGNNEILMKISVTDKKKVPEGDAIIKFMEVGGKKEIKGKTDSIGKLDLIIPQGKKFNITCEKYGITFKFGETQMPTPGMPVHFTYDLEIGIDTIYQRQYTLENVYLSQALSA